MASEICEIMDRFDEILEVPEVRFRGGRVKMQAIKCVVVGDGAVGEADNSVFISVQVCGVVDIDH